VHAIRQSDRRRVRVVGVVGRRIRYTEASDPATLAAAIAAEAGRAVDYRPVETDGAARAAALLGELI
jgi:hypothetical protein